MSAISLRGAGRNVKLNHINYVCAQGVTGMKIKVKSISVGMHGLRRNRLSDSHCTVTLGQEYDFNPSDRSFKDECGKKVHIQNMGYAHVNKLDFVYLGTPANECDVKFVIVGGKYDEGGATAAASASE